MSASGGRALGEMRVEDGSHAVEIRGLRKRFDGQDVLQGLDWSIPRGRTIGLLGRNGAGKTTLLRCMLGLMPINGGTVEILGEPMDEPRGERLHRIGYVPQTFDLFPWMKVAAFLDFTSAFYRSWDAALCARLLEEWSIDTRKRISTLSQGQRQMLAIIRALAPGPDLILLDEPVASLDPKARRDFLATLMPLIQGTGRTVVFSTHITTDLERIDADIALLRDGAIAFTRPVQAVREQIQKAVLRADAGTAYVEPPQVPGVLAARVDGGAACYVVDAGNPETLTSLQALAKREQAQLSFTTLSLEDLFVEMA